MSYKNAFNCKRCPKSNGEDGCPCWWEIPWENEQTGELQYRKGCILSMEVSLPIIQAIVRSAHVASEHASQARNQFHDGFTQLNQLAALAIQQKQEMLNEEATSCTNEGDSTCADL